MMGIAVWASACAHPSLLSAGNCSLHNCSSNTNMNYSFLCYFYCYCYCHCYCYCPYYCHCYCSQPATALCTTVAETQNHSKDILGRG